VKKENNQARDIQNRSTKEKAILQGKDLVDWERCGQFSLNRHKELKEILVYIWSIMEYSYHNEGTDKMPQEAVCWTHKRIEWSYWERSDQKMRKYGRSQEIFKKLLKRDQCSGNITVWNNQFGDCGGWIIIHLSNAMCVA
jgi:hypothetical protein